MSKISESKGFLGKLKGSDELTITVTGRKSKKKISTPVWFSAAGDQRVLLVPVRGSDTNWFRNLRKNPEIELGVGNAKFSSKAKLVTDPKSVEKILDQFREKYKSSWSESYYSKRDAYVEIPL